MVCEGIKDKGTPNAVTTLLFYPIDFSSSVSLQWKVKLSGEVRNVQLLTGRRELIVVMKDKKMAHRLDISNGTILQTISLSSVPYLTFSILGSICCHLNVYDTNHHLIDTQTGREFDLRKKGVYSNKWSSLYGCLCAKRQIVGNTLTILDWYNV